MLWLCLLVGVAANKISNDFCTGAITITAGAGVGTTVGATGPYQVYRFYGNDVFYKYIATTTGWATFTHTSPNQQSTSYLSAVVFYGSSCAKLGHYSYYANYSSFDNSGEITWPIFNGSTYYISVGSYDKSETYQTSFTWTLSTATDNTPTAGDSCRSPITFPASGQATISIDGATKQDYEFDGSTDVFLWYTANCTGTATVTTIAPFDSALSSYYSQSCDDAIGLPNYKTTDSFGNATIDFPVWNGAGYLLAVGPYYSTASGSIDVSITCAPASPPANDVCTTATQVMSNSFSTSTTGANTDFNPQLCYYYAPQREVWIAYNATCTGKLQLSTNDTYVAVLRGSSCDGAQLLGCSSGYNHTIDVTNGDNLWFAIGYYEADNYVGTFTCTPVNNYPANTYCAAPSALSSTTQTFSFVNAITDPGSMRSLYTQSGDFCYYNYYTEFFTYNATCTGDATFTLNSTTGSNLGFLVYQDSQCAAWSEPAICEPDLTSGGYGTYVFENVNQDDLFYLGVSYYDSNAVVGNVELTAVCNGVGSTGAPTSSGTSTPTSSGTGTPTPSSGTSTPTSSGTSTPTTSKAPTTSGSVAPTTNGTTYAPTPSVNGTSAPTAAVAAAGIVEFGMATFLGFLLL